MQERGPFNIPITASVTIEMVESVARSMKKGEKEILLHFPVIYRTAGSKKKG